MRHGAMSPSLALALVLRLIEMQQKLHERKIVHADIKPSNILVSTQDIREIYIIDFGMAEIDTARNELVLAVTNRYLHPLIRYGTLPPPSDAVTPGEEDEIPKTTIARRLPSAIPVPQPGPYLDLYATGIVAFEMLTGGARAPYPLLRIDFIGALRNSNPSLRETATDDLNLLHAVVAKLVSVRPGEADHLEGLAMRLIAQARAVFGGDPEEAAAYLARPAPPLAAGELRPEPAPTVVAAIGRLAKLSDEIDAATQVSRRPRQVPPSEVLPPTVVERVAAADHGADDALIEIRQVFQDAGRRERHAWKISIAMIISAFAVIVLMICLSAVFSLLTGKAVWALVFGGVGASTVLTTLLWRPFDRLMRANILLQQLSVLQIQTAVAYRDSRTAQEKIKILSDVSKRLDAVFVSHAKPEPSK
jgi:serine/threonine protein kinase